MGTFDKFIVKLNKIPKDVTFKELHGFLTNSRVNLSFRVRGSHFIYYIMENDVVKDLLVVPNHGIVKTVYIKKVVQLLKEWGIENEE